MNFDVAKIRFWEKRFWNTANRVVAMSYSDKKIMRNLVPNLTVDLVPNGVDTEFFSHKERKKNNRKTVLFVGNFKWLQNREAVTILVEKTWKVIKEKLPSAHLWIVGRFPPPEIKNLASSSITVSSDVDDIRNAYKMSDVLLAPIYGPGGTRYKILEAMAAGVPVVTTKTGIEGLGAKRGVDAIIEENPENLALETVGLLKDENLYNKLALNGRKLVEKNFNWKSIAKNLDDIYQKATYVKN